MGRDPPRADGTVIDAESPVRDANDDVSPDALSRRGVLRGGGKLLVYSAPLVQLFRPSAAYAATNMTTT